MIRSDYSPRHLLHLIAAFLLVGLASFGLATAAHAEACDGSLLISSCSGDGTGDDGGSDSGGAGTGGDSGSGSGSNSGGSTPANPGPRVLSGQAREMLDRVNSERRSHGLPPLAWSTGAADIARDHSLRMEDADTIFHNDAYFSDATRDRLHAGKLGENVAVAASMDQAHNALMQSAPHRANILDAQFTHLGIGIVESADGDTFITQDFLTKVAPAPAVEAAADPGAAVPAGAPTPAGSTAAGPTRPSGTSPVKVKAQGVRLAAAGGGESTELAAGFDPAPAGGSTPAAIPTALAGVAAALTVMAGAGATVAAPRLRRGARSR